MSEKKETTIGITQITRKGQITLLKEVRDKLKLEKGDKLYVKIRNGEIILRPVE